MRLRRGRPADAKAGCDEFFVVSTDARGLITALSTAAERVLGYSQAEVAGRVCFEVFVDPGEIVARARQRTMPPGFDAFVASVLDQSDCRPWALRSKRDRSRGAVMALVAIADVDRRRSDGFSFLGVPAYGPHALGVVSSDFVWTSVSGDLCFASATPERISGYVGSTLPVVDAASVCVAIDRARTTGRPATVELASGRYRIAAAPAVSDSSQVADQQTVVAIHEIAAVCAV